jgi:hypothetical protein
MGRPNQKIGMGQPFPFQAALEQGGVLFLSYHLPH